MKLTYITLFFFSIVLLRAANPSADNRPQEKLSYQSIFNQIIATPEKAINLADREPTDHTGIQSTYHPVTGIRPVEKREESAGIRSSRIPHRFRTKRLHGLHECLPDTK